MFKHQHCGGKHNTVSEARNCEATPAGTRSLVNATAAYSTSIDRLRAQKPHPSIARAARGPAWHADTATERQVSYLKDLIAKRCAERASIDVVETAMHVMEGKPISFAEARKAIEEIKALPYRQEKQGSNEYAQPVSSPPASPQATRPNVKALKAQVPDGRYAVNVPGFGQDKLQFFFVRTNRRGYVRIDQVVSDSRMPVAFSKYADVLRAIIAAGTKEAGKAYADNMGQCFNCGRALTDPDNAYKPFGLGPDCGPKVMGGL